MGQPEAGDIVSMPLIVCIYGYTCEKPSLFSMLGTQRKHKVVWPQNRTGDSVQKIGFKNRTRIGIEWEKKSKEGRIITEDHCNQVQQNMPRDSTDKNNIGWKYPKISGSTLM